MNEVPYDARILQQSSANLVETQVASPTPYGIVELPVWPWPRLLEPNGCAAAFPSGMASRTSAHPILCKIYRPEKVNPPLSLTDCGEAS